MAVGRNGKSTTPWSRRLGQTVPEERSMSTDEVEEDVEEQGAVVLVLPNLRLSEYMPQIVWQMLDS